MAAEEQIPADWDPCWDSEERRWSRGQKVSHQIYSSRTTVKHKFGPSDESSWSTVTHLWFVLTERNGLNSTSLEEKRFWTIITSQNGSVIHINPEFLHPACWNSTKMSWWNTRKSKWQQWSSPCGSRGAVYFRVTWKYEYLKRINQAETDALHEKGKHKWIFLFGCFKSKTWKARFYMFEAATG